MNVAVNPPPPDDARSGVLAAGNWIVDKIKLIDTYPQQDALANILSESTDNGGSPFNLLIDLSRLGASFPLSGVGLIGEDAEGEWIRNRCAAAGIDSTGLRTIPDDHTSCTDVMTVRSTGRRTFFHRRGANARLSPADFDFSAVRARFFHLGYLLLLDSLDAPDPAFGTAAAKVLYAAKQAGCVTSVDVVSEDSDRFAELVIPCLPHVDYCILNDFEIGRTTGIEVRNGNAIDLSRIKTACRELIAAGVGKAVIVHYPEGTCALEAGGNFLSQGSVKMPESLIRGTVGAGDAFAAGLLYALHNDRPFSSALKSATAAAASCLLEPGASAGIRPLPDCLKLIEQYGVQSLV